MNRADPLSDVLRSVSLTGAVFLSAELGAPWGFAAPAASTVGHLLAPGTEHIVLFHLVIDGKAKVRVPGQEDLMLAPGDIVVLPRGDAHELWSGPRRTFTDSSSLLPRILGGALASERGGGDGPLTQFVCGYIGCDATPIDSFWRGCRRRSRSTCAATRPARGSGARSVISRPSSAQLAGRRALLAKLAEALFIDVLRRYMAELPSSAPAGSRRRASCGRTRARLPAPRAGAPMDARRARAASGRLAQQPEHFPRLIGETPLAYLARWRVQLGRAFCEPRTTRFSGSRSTSAIVPRRRSTARSGASWAFRPPAIAARRAEVARDRTSGRSRRSGALGRDWSASRG